MTPNPNPGPELKPCPFCQSPDAEMRPLPTQDKNGSFVICVACSALGPTRRDRCEAIAAWNTRALSQTLAAPGEVDFRALLIEAGRNAGAYLDDRVSDDFLKVIPEEVRLRIASLATVAAANDEGVARIIDPAAWADYDFWAGRLRGEGNWPDDPKQRETMRASYQRRMPERIAPSLAKAAAISLLSQGAGK